MNDRIVLDDMTSDQLDRLYERLEAAESDLAELTCARQHRAYTFCAQSVGHVTVAEFARKIAEKREAIGQRAEAVRYANQQKQRAERVEAALADLAPMIRRERDDMDIPGSPANADHVSGMSHAAELVDLALADLTASSQETAA